MEQQTTCPIWGTPATEVVTSRDGRLINSPRTGGRFFISGTAAAIVGQQDEPLKVRLTSWLVEQRRLGEQSPEIGTHSLGDAAKRRSPSVEERAARLLLFVASRSPMIGRPFAFSKRWLDRTENAWKPSSAFLELFAHSHSSDATELDFLFDHLSRQGFVTQRTFLPGVQNSGPHSDHEDYFEYALTPAGYAKIGDLSQQHSVSSQAFVAMWFDASMQDAYENGIAPAIRDAGYEPLRIDGKQHNNKIDDEIIAEIKRSRFVVADFTHGDTGPRGGVYYEAGFAHGHDIPVIFTCSANTIDKVHFDTRQYNHIAWQDVADLRVRLANRISATIGDGPAKKRL